MTTFFPRDMLFFLFVFNSNHLHPALQRSCKYRPMV